MGIAFFDLDNTLLDINSGRAWLDRELQLGHLSRWQALRAAFWLFGYGLGMTSVDKVVIKGIATLAGTPEQELRARTKTFYERCVRHHFRPGARLALKAHRKAGDQLVLLTASSAYLSENVMRELDLNDIICTRLEVDAHGVYTGRTMGALCFGKGKLEHAQAFALKAGIPLSECHFYTDSYTDMPVLNAVGKPRPVHPDYRLRRAALHRHWPIIDWGTPTLV